MRPLSVALRVGLSCLGLVLPASAVAEVLVMSRHSGTILHGPAVEIRESEESRRLLLSVGSTEGPLTTLALAEAARVRAAVDDVPLALQGPGWNLRVDDDRVLVRTGPNLDASLAAAGRTEAKAEVQVFGLVDPRDVAVRCAGNGYRTGPSVVPLPGGWLPLSAAMDGGSILCTGGPWEVRVHGGRTRPYAGTFTMRPAPGRVPEVGATARQARARRGSDMVFTTTLGEYVAGVLVAEHAGLAGEARLALAQVVAHDASATRHPGRPLCDTTHCQVFRGTAAPGAVERSASALDPLPGTGWLPYFRGGSEGWAARRTVGQVRALLGDVRSLSGEGQQIQVTSTEGTSTRPCESVRSALRLPGCPRSAEFEGQSVLFRGTGQGHGLGLDVDAAARSNLDARALLERAYRLRLSDRAP